MSLRLNSFENGNSGILFIGFNQDQSCFAVGLESGFRVFNTDPLKQYIKNDFHVKDGTGVGYIEMMQRTNYLGMLGGGSQSRLPLQSAHVWNCADKDFILDFKYPIEVKSIKLRSDRIAIVLPTEIKVYTFNKTSDLIHSAETFLNPHGLCHLCQQLNNPIIAYPGKQPGQVVLVNIGLQSRTNHSAQSSPPPRQIEAHKNTLAALVMNSDGTLLATASDTGTLVRIFDVSDCQLKYELRRGMNSAQITSINFNKSSQYICVMSDHNTVHVFDLSLLKNNSHSAGNSQLSNKIFTSNQSKIRCHIDTKFKCICAFSESSVNSLIILAANGYYYKYTFTPNGEVTPELFCNFLHISDDTEDLL